MIRLHCCVKVNLKSGRSTAGSAIRMAKGTVLWRYRSKSPSLWGGLHNSLSRSFPALSRRAGHGQLTTELMQLATPMCCFVALTRWRDTFETSLRVLPRDLSNPTRGSKEQFGLLQARPRLLTRIMQKYVSRPADWLDLFRRFMRKISKGSIINMPRLFYNTIISVS